MDSNLAVNSVSFSGKQHFLSQTAQQNLREVLGKMNKETIYKEYGDTFESKILKCLKIDNTGRIFDNRALVKPVHNNIQGHTSVEFPKAHLEIDNVTGKIVNYEKPFWIRLKNLQKKQNIYLK